MLRVLRALKSRASNFYFRFRGVRLGGYVWLGGVEIPRNFRDIELEAGCALDRGVVLLCSGEPTPEPKIWIGRETYVNRYTFLDATESLRIGRQCAIGPGCYLTDHDHGFLPDRPPLEQPMQSRPTRIDDRVWIGANVTVLKGVRIGESAVIGAGSVVTRDIPPRVVAVGSPARVIRRLGEPAGD